MEENTSSNRYNSAVIYSKPAVASRPKSKFKLDLHRGESYYSCLNFKEKAILAESLSLAISSAVLNGARVFLSGFGIFFPIEVQEKYPETNQTEVTIYQETSRSIGFEKCIDDDSIQSRDSLLDWTKLANEVRNSSARLGLVIPTLVESKGAINGLVADLRKEITLHGNSNLLSALGVFCALHNRQGNTEKDWFQGSDIFLCQTSKKSIAKELLKTTKLPVLNTAWEPLEAAYGSPINNFEIDLVQILDSLKFDTKHLIDDQYGPTKISVAAFFKQDSNSVIFCTNGLRSRARSNNPAENITGTEITMQLPVENLAEATLIAEEDSWITLPIALGWMLLHTSSSRTIKPSVAFSLDVPLKPNSNLTAIFTSDFPLSPNQHLSKEGFFKYISITGICSDELASADSLSPTLLESMLKRRGLLTETRINRSSILRSTELSSVFH
ncbi:MAG: hypothetical protein R3A13_10920 [Bdellovibrionota bacterium]